jgi:hypothetical protein
VVTKVSEETAASVFRVCKAGIRKYRQSPKHSRPIPGSNTSVVFNLGYVKLKKN